MKETILVAGATGNLGTRISKYLINRGVNVIAIVRPDSNRSKLLELEKLGLQIIEVNMSDSMQIIKACEGVACLVSALAGLHEVVIDLQTILLNAAVEAGVPRFIPSDFASDFTKLPSGGNRNFDLRREFHKRIEGVPIRTTSILNGAFTDILTYNTPTFDIKNRRVAYWGNKADWKIDFTTMDETAAFTAAAALDITTPRFLRIASFQISPKELSTIATGITKNEFKLLPMGSLEDLASYNIIERAKHPEGENELYPRWQSSQYMHDMFSTHHENLDNGRYLDLTWTNAEDFLKNILAR